MVIRATLIIFRVVFFRKTIYTERPDKLRDIESDSVTYSLMSLTDYNPHLLDHNQEVEKHRPMPTLRQAFSCSYAKS